MKNRNEFDDEEGYSPHQPFMLSAKPIGVDYTVNINEAFTHSKQFEYIVHALDNASEADHFTINLTTPGGSLQAVLPLLGAMQDTAAHVHVHACSDVASAGTFILMSAHSVSLNDYVEIMFHQVRFGSVGPGWNVERQVEHVLKSSKRLIRDAYKHFFTPVEIEEMLKGTDFYMDKEEFCTRYQKRIELMTEEIEAILSAPKPAKKRKPLVKKVVDTIEVE